MIEFVKAYVEYSMQGPQEFLIGCSPFGFLALVFGKKIKRDFVAAVSPPKTAKRSTKRTIRKTRTVQKAKAKKAKPKKWAKPPKYTARELENIENYYRKRDQRMRVDKTDNWGGGIPL